MSNQQDNKPKAVWTNSVSVGEFQAKVSEKGCIKFEDKSGRMVGGFIPGSAFEALHLIMTSLSGEQVTELLAQAQGTKAKTKEVKRIEHEMGQNQDKAIKHLQAQIDYLRAKGQDASVFETALAAILVKAVRAA